MTSRPDVARNAADALVASVASMDAVPTILDIVCRTTGLGFAAVGGLTPGHWIACVVRDDIALGVRPGSQVRLETTVCESVRRTGEAVFIDDVETDAFHAYEPPLVANGLRSYAAVPIVLRDGTCFATLCAMDREPRPVNTPEVSGMLKGFADLIASHIDDREMVRVSDAALTAERRDGKLRDEFISILGHDLRNPLHSIDAAATLLDKHFPDQKGQALIHLMSRSVGRMEALINDVLDFARGRLGHGLELDLICRRSLGPVFEQVVTEMRLAVPGAVIETKFDLERGVRCDPGRLGQLLSNLLANAVAHGDNSTSIFVEASTAGGGLELAVVNGGPAIPEDARARLFEPFYRSGGSPGQGLGLGLYICRMVADAHDGRLDVESRDGETRFSLSVPSDPLDG